MEGLGDGFGRLLGRFLEARGDFWEVKWERKGNKNEERKKTAKKSEKRARVGWYGGNAKAAGEGLGRGKPLPRELGETSETTKVTRSKHARARQSSRAD